jgi:hypothetical protein
MRSPEQRGSIPAIALTAYAREEDKKVGSQKTSEFSTSEWPFAPTTLDFFPTPHTLFAIEIMVSQEIDEQSQYTVAQHLNKQDKDDIYNILKESDYFCQNSQNGRKNKVERSSNCY